jgi:hypothetical protein
MKKGADMKRIHLVLYFFLIVFLLAGCAKGPSVTKKEEPKLKETPPAPVVLKKPPVAPPPPAPAIEKLPEIARSIPDSKVWVRYGKTKMGENYYNKTNITRSSDVATVNVYRVVTDSCRKQMVEEVRKYNPKKSIKYHYYEHDVRVDEIDCRNQKWRVKELIHYDEKGKVLDHHTYENEPWEKIKFVTDHHTLQKSICVAEEKPAAKKPAAKKKKK